MARLCVAWIASLTKVGHVSKCIYFVLPKEKEKEKEKKKPHTHTQSVWAHLNGNYTRIPLNLAAVCTKR